MSHASHIGSRCVGWLVFTPTSRYHFVFFQRCRRLALVGSSRSGLKSTWQIIASSLLSFHASQANPRTAIVFMASADDPAPKGNAVSSQQQQTYAHPLDIAVSLYLSCRLPPTVPLLPLVSMHLCRSSITLRRCRQRCWQSCCCTSHLGSAWAPARLSTNHGNQQLP